MENRTLNYVEGRAKLFQWLEKQLIGPASSEDELLGSPLDRYPTGILFPIMRGEGCVDPASFSDENDDDNVDEIKKPSLELPDTKRRRFMPSASVGFSFFVRGVTELEIECSAARY